MGPRLGHLPKKLLLWTWGVMVLTAHRPTQKNRPSPVCTRRFTIMVPWAVQIRHPTKHQKLDKTSVRNHISKRWENIQHGGELWLKSRSCERHRGPPCSMQWVWV